MHSKKEVVAGIEVKDNVLHLYITCQKLARAKLDNQLEKGCLLLIEKIDNLPTESRVSYRTQKQFAYYELGRITLNKVKPDDPKAGQYFDEAYRCFYTAVVNYQHPDIGPLYEMVKSQKHEYLRLSESSRSEYKKMLMHAACEFVQRVINDDINDKSFYLLPHQIQEQNIHILCDLMTLLFKDNIYIWYAFLKALDKLICYQDCEGISFANPKKILEDYTKKVSALKNKENLPDFVSKACSAIICLNFEKQLTQKQIEGHLSQAHFLLGLYRLQKNKESRLLLAFFQFQQAHHLDHTNIHAIYYALSFISDYTRNNPSTFAFEVSGILKSLIETVGIGDKFSLLDKLSLDEKRNLFNILHTACIDTTTFTPEEKESLDQLLAHLFNELVKITPHDAKLYFLRGQSLSKEKNIELADTKFEIIELYLKAALFNTKVYLNELASFLESLPRDASNQSIIEDLNALKALKQPSSKLPIFVSLLLSLSHHLGDYLNLPEKQPEQVFQMNILDYLVLLHKGNKEPGEKLQILFQKIVKLLVDSKCTFAQKGIKKLQDDLDVFYQNSRSKQYKINLLAMVPKKEPRKAQKSQAVKPKPKPAPQKEVNKPVPVVQPKTEKVETPVEKEPQSIPTSNQLNNTKQQQSQGRLLSQQSFYNKRERHTPPPTKRSQKTQTIKTEALPSQPLQEEKKETAPILKEPMVVGQMDEMDPQLQAILDFFHEAKIDAYGVGSYPREWLRGKVDLTTLNDSDVVVAGLPPEGCQSQTIAGLQFRRHPKKTKLFTAKSILRMNDGTMINRSYDIYYSEALLYSLEIDARTRNFTINTFYLRFDRKILSPLPEAIDHLQDELIQTVTGGLEGFINDPSWFFTYFSLMKKGYHGVYETAVLQAIFHHVKDNKRIHGDQIFGKLSRFLMEGTSKESFELFWQQGFIPIIFPGIKENAYQYLIHEMKNIDSQLQAGNSITRWDVYLPFIIAGLESDVADALNDSQDGARLVDEVRKVIKRYGYLQKIQFHFIYSETCKDPHIIHTHQEKLLTALNKAMEMRQINEGKPSYAATVTLGVLKPATLQLGEAFEEENRPGRSL